MSYFVESFKSWKDVGLCQMIFFVYWDGNVIFSVFYKCDILHILAYASLYPRDKWHFFMVYDHLMCTWIMLAL
jgi:hypothetical protein